MRKAITDPGLDDVRTDFEVIVIGGGGSGLAAATSAAAHGLDVLVLEKRPECGGTTGIAVGSFTGCFTKLQRCKGIEDSVAAHAADAAKFAAPEIEAQNNGLLRRMFLGETAATLDWLMSMGVAFQGPSPEPPNRVPRMHNVAPGAQAYIAALRDRLIRLGGHILCQSRAEKLLQEHGRVIGVRAATDLGRVWRAEEHTLNQPQNLSNDWGPPQGPTRTPKVRHGDIPRQFAPGFAERYLLPQMLQRVDKESTICTRFMRVCAFAWDLGHSAISTVIW